MAICELKITLPWTTPSVSGPASVNTLYVDSGASNLTPATLADTFAAVSALYTSDLTGIWGSILTGEVLVAAYNLSDATPRIPVLEAEYNLGGLGAGSAVPEVAINVGFRAAYESGVSKRKFRGRNYLGPLALDQNMWTLDGHLAPAVVEQVADAFATFAAAVSNVGTFSWVCGSEANGFKDVSIVSVKDECATLRSRQNTTTVTEIRNL